MKALDIKLYLLACTMMMLAIASCSRKLFLDRNKETSALNRSSSEVINTNISAASELSRSVTIRDSSESVLHIEIFPKDTFFYSPAYGFKGVASKIIIRAHQNHLINRSELQAERKEENSQSTTTRKDQISAERTKKSAVKQRTSDNSWVLTFLIVVIGLGAYYVLSIWWRRK